MALKGSLYLEEFDQLLHFETVLVFGFHFATLQKEKLILTLAEIKKIFLRLSRPHLARVPILTSFRLNIFLVDQFLAIVDDVR